MLIELLVGIIVLCIALYLIQNYVPGDPKLKGLACIVVIVIFLAWLLGGYHGHGLLNP